MPGHWTDGLTRIDAPSGALAQRAREAGARFPCPKDEIGSADVSPRGSWVATASESGRAAISYVPDVSPLLWLDMGGFEVRVDEWGEVVAERAILPDLERAARNRERAVARAKREVTEYIVHNRLGRMWTLTFGHPQYSRARVIAVVNDFMQRWRGAEGKPFPYLYVAELHPDGHGWHVHMAVPDWLYAQKHELQKIWGWGIVQFSARRKGAGSRRDYRRLAGYLTKYFSKDWGDELEPGSHRYERARGFSPLVVSVRFESRAAALEWLEGLDGYSFAQVWSSEDSLDWCGPPSTVYLSD